MNSARNAVIWRPLEGMKIYRISSRIFEQNYVMNLYVTIDKNNFNKNLVYFQMLASSFHFAVHLTSKRIFCFHLAVDLNTGVYILLQSTLDMSSTMLPCF